MRTRSPRRFPQCADAVSRNIPASAKRRGVYQPSKNDTPITPRARKSGEQGGEDNEGRHGGDGSGECPDGGEDPSPPSAAAPMPLPLSALDLVPLLRGGTSSASLRDAVDLARAIERFGYARIWYAEHHNMPGIATTTPEILIAHVGAGTHRIRLGAGGVMLPNHSPLKVAESYKLLEAIHPGRIDLGIGRAPGTDGLTAFALRRSRQAMTADDFLEQLGELRAWGGEQFPPDHPLCAVRAMPDDQRLPPIYILGSSDYGAKVAADLGLGYAFAGHFSTDPPELALRLYRDRFTPSAALDRPHAILALSVFCADTEDAAPADGVVDVALVRAAPDRAARGGCPAPTRRSRTRARPRSRRS